MSITATTPDLDQASAFIRDGWPDATAIWLFGSMVDGRQRADSDIALAVLAPMRIDALLRFELQRDLGVLLDRDVDLVDLASANTVLRCEVVSRGRLLWSSHGSGLAVEFVGRVLTEYGNWRDMTRPLREAIRTDGRIVAQ